MVAAKRISFTRRALLSVRGIVVHSTNVHCYTQHKGRLRQLCYFWKDFLKKADYPPFPKAFFPSSPPNVATFKKYDLAPKSAHMVLRNMPLMLASLGEAVNHRPTSTSMKFTLSVTLKMMPET